MQHPKRKPEARPKRRSWLRRHASELTIGLLAGLLVLLVGERIQIGRDLSNVRNHRQELLNAALAEIQSNHRFITINNRLLRGEQNAMRASNFRLLPNVSPVTELYEGYERSLTEIAPLLRSDTQALTRLVDIARNARLINEQVRRHEALKAELLSRQDALTNFWICDSVLYALHRGVLGMIENPDTIWKRIRIAP